jgi:hypothetical protein
MKVILVVVALALCASQSVSAATPSCEAQAADKKLSFTAKARFINQCQKVATEAATELCASQAADKQLAGRAKTSYVKKCAKDATRSRPVNSGYTGPG